MDKFEKVKLQKKWFSNSSRQLNAEEKKMHHCFEFRGWHCNGAMNKLVFTPDSVIGCCTATDGVEPPAFFPNYKGEIISRESYFKQVKKLITSNNSHNRPPRCQNCKELKYGAWKVSSDIKVMTLHHQTPCNLSCIYCRPEGWEKGLYGWWDMHKPAQYSVLPLIRSMAMNGALGRPFTLCYGGGEPSIQKDFPEHLDLFKRLKFDVVNIYTNAVRFSPILAERIADAVKYHRQNKRRCRDS